MSQVQLQELDAVTNAVELDIAFWNSEAFDLVWYVFSSSYALSSTHPLWQINMDDFLCFLAHTSF